MSTAAVVLRHLSAAGVRHVFGYPGGANIDFIEEARREGFSLVLARREGTAAFMAEAYGMVTGLPGVCMSTLGPGSTSLVNGVANAMLDRVPMLAISGQAPEWREPYFTHQVIDHNRLFAPVTKWATRLVPASAAVTMRKALKIAMADRPGPVHLTASADAMRTPVPDEPVRLPPFRPALGLPSHPGVSEAWESVVRALGRAERPVISVGVSALRSGAAEALASFVEATGCAVAVAPMAKGIFPERHPRFVGSFDMACGKMVWEFLEQADLHLLVGFDAVELTTDWTLGAPAIHIDALPNTDQVCFAETELVGSIPATLRALAESFTGQPRWEDGAIAVHRERLDARMREGAVRERLNPMDVVDVMNQALPDGAVVSTDVGSHKQLVGQAWAGATPGSFLMTNGLSSMGFSLPAAMTAKMLLPERPVVCTTGDGGFAMVPGELRLASELGLGIVVLVFTDGSLNRIEIKQQLQGYASELTRIEDTDVAALAGSMGCDGTRVETVRELEAVMASATEPRDRPLVADVRIDPAQYVAQF